MVQAFVPKYLAGTKRAPPTVVLQGLHIMTRRERRWCGAKDDDVLVSEGGNLGAAELLGGGGGDRVGGEEGGEEEERAHRG